MIRYNTISETMDAKNSVSPDDDIGNIEFDSTIIPSDKDPFDSLGLSKALDNDPDHSCIMPNCESGILEINRILEGGAPEPGSMLENGMAIINSILGGEDNGWLTESELFMINNSIQTLTESEQNLIQRVVFEVNANNIQSKQELEDALDNIAAKPTAHGILLKLLKAASFILACAVGGAAGSALLSAGFTVAMSVLASIGIVSVSLDIIEWLITKLYNILTRNHLTTEEDKKRRLIEMRSIFEANMYTAKKHNNMKAYEKLKEFRNRVNDELSDRYSPRYSYSNRI